VNFVDDLCRDDQAAAALRRFAEVAVDVAGTAQAALGGLADIALAVAMADAYVHGHVAYADANRCQLRLSIIAIRRVPRALALR
jgi:hypothetical protein